MVAISHSVALGAQTMSADITRPLPESGTVLAQAGSTGGTVLKQGKSVSGDQDTEPTRSAKERKKPELRAKPKSSASFEGTWHGVSTGTCKHDYTWTLEVRNGIMSGAGSQGHVSAGGTTDGSMTVLGTRYAFKGRAVSLTAISGTWTRLDGCSGKWKTNSISQ
jgi:hypothetical protein